MEFALRPPHPEDGRDLSHPDCVPFWSEEQLDEIRGIQQEDPRLEEKLKEIHEKMRETLEETQEFLWKRKDDKDFEKKSEDFIDYTIANLEKDLVVEFGKFLDQPREKRQQTKESKDQGQQLAVAKELINSAKDEDKIILEAVSRHVSGTVAELDDKKVD